MNERIKKLRQELGLSQEEFGRRIGLLSKASVSKIEKGTNGTTEQTLRSICRVYGASYLWLTTGEGSMFEDGGDDAALHVMIDRIMASENNRVKQVFKSLGCFTVEDWKQIDQLLDKLLSGMKPWEEDEKRTDPKVSPLTWSNQRRLMYR